MKGSQGITHKLTEASIATEYFVSINGCELREIDILDFESVFGGCTVDAKLTFQDTQGFMSGELPGSSSLAVGGFVRIGWLAAGGCGGEYDETFSIQNVQSTTDTNNRKLVVLDLIDAESHNLKQTYKNKVYKEKKYSEIVKDHLDLVKSNVPSPREMKIVKNDKEIKQSLVVPSNISAFDFHKLFAKENGMKITKDKFNTYMVDKNKTTFELLNVSDEVFDVDAINEYSYWRILQYNLDGFNMSSLMNSIPTALTNSSVKPNLEDDDTSASCMSTDHKKTSQTQGIESVSIKDAITTKGVKTGVKTSADLNQYFDTLSSAQTCSIWVPGLHINRIHKKVTVNFPRPSYLSSDRYDEVFSGKWEVYGVRDKVVKTYFIQELFLKRPGG